MSKIKAKFPRKLSLVWCILTKEVLKKYKYPFKTHKTYIFIGEIVNMPEHCIVQDYNTGESFIGYHTYIFKEIPKEEV